MLFTDFERILVKMYVDGEFAQELNLIVNGYDPNPLAVSLKNGMTSHLYYDDIYNIPTKGMIYVDGDFTDGSNGETFRVHHPARDLDYDLFIFLKDNQVLDFWLIPSHHPLFEQTIAILKSNPTFEIIE